MNNYSKQEKEKTTTLFFCESKCGFCTVFRFFFISPFLFLSVATTSKLIKREESLSLSLFNWFRSLLSFSRVLLFSVVACSRLAACFARFVNAVRLGCNSSFLLVIFIHGTPSATQPLLFFFLVLYFPIGFFSPYIVNDSFFFVFHLSFLYKSHDTLFFSFRSSHSHTCKKKKVSFSFFLHTLQT